MCNFPLETKFVVSSQASRGCDSWMGCLWWNDQRPLCLGNCPDKLRKMTWGVAEGWQLAAPRMGVLSGLRGSRKEGIKTAMNIWRHKDFIFKQSNTSLKCVSPHNLCYSYCFGVCLFVLSFHSLYSEVSNWFPYQDVRQYIFQVFRAHNKSKMIGRHSFQLQSFFSFFKI